ncbi:MAG: carboxymuconolactone decarboxylase family protein [Sandaracinus sp.]|nr:carboxymuconolactone decarboxylase family protein [Myxococcales bacterium]MCB9615825.1 carboxymuconolactone decarboxylase family protein [Sandaracinus sp.]MCB9621494.1 carboxymuconolactone decarboxylase family protein [Sandaracinus sp.]
MSRIALLTDDQASESVRPKLEAVRRGLGTVPNLVRVFARSEAALDGYLAFSGALGKGSLPAKLREQIALVVAETNGCEYCLAAHSFLGGRVGLDRQAIAAARDGHAEDTKTDVALAFAREVAAGRGRASDDTLSKAIRAGWSEGELVEIVAHVALNVLTNFTNNVAHTPVDFPAP